MSADAFNPVHDRILEHFGAIYVDKHNTTTHPCQIIVSTVDAPWSSLSVLDLGL